MNTRKNNKKSSVSLPVLPNDVWDRHILPSMSLKKMGLFSLVNKPSTQTKTPVYNPALITLFKLVECGLQRSVRRLLSKASTGELNELLCASLSFQDRLGNPVILTAWQLALKNYDHIMYHLLKRYFDKLPNGLDEKRRQFKAIYPGKIEYQVKANEIIENAVDKVLTDISNDDAGSNRLHQNIKMNPTTKQSIDAFYEIVMQHKSDLIAIYFTALSHYVKKLKARQFKDKNTILFEVKVLGYLQNRLPTGFLRIKSSGFTRVINSEGIINDRKLLSRDGCLVDNHFFSVSLFSMSDQPFIKLGIKHHLDIFGHHYSNVGYGVSCFDSQLAYTDLILEHAITDLNKLALELEHPEQNKKSGCSLM